MQRVGTEVFLHDEHHTAARSKPAVPKAQQFVKGSLPDSDGRVRPNLVDHEIDRYVVDSDGLCVRIPGEILGREFHRSTVHVDSPNRGGRCAVRERHCNRAVAAAHIDQGSRR